MESLQTRAERLLKERAFLDEQARSFGGEKAATTLEIYSRANSLVSEFKELEGKAKEIENSDLATKIKFSRKTKKSAKEFWRMVREINDLHKNGKMDEGDAKRFGAVLEKVKAKKYADAETELGKFKRLELLSQGVARSDSEFRELSKELESRINSLERELSESEASVSMEELEKKSEKYLAAKKILEDYQLWRDRQVSKFKSMQARNLIKACLANEDLFKMGLPRPKDEFSFEELGEFLTDSKIDADTKRVLELADLRTEDLKKHLVDHHMFKRLVNENSEWLESAEALEGTDFLSFDFVNGERNQGIMSAIGASNDKKLESEMKSLLGLSRGDFEDSKAAHRLLEQLKSTPKKQEKQDPAKIRSEISELRKIKSELPAGKG